MATYEYVIVSGCYQGSNVTKHSHSQYISTINNAAKANIPAGAVISSVQIYLDANWDSSIGDPDLWFYLSNEGNDGSGIQLYKSTLDSEPDIHTVDITGWVTKTYPFSINTTQPKISVYYSSTLGKKYHCDVFKIIYTYSVPTYTLTVNAGTGGTVSGGGIYNNQETATLKAIPNVGYKFVKWSDGNTSATRTVTVTGNATYTATFEPITYSIGYVANGGEGSMNAVSATFNTAVTLPDCTFTRKEIVQLQYEEGNNQRTEVNLPFAGWMDYTGATDKYGTYYPYQEFDAPYYANTQADLYAAFGYDKFALVNHYVDHGKAEGRKCVSDTGVRGTYPNKATVKNLTTGGGGSASLYAAWGAASFTLPTPTREGYNFLHWVDDNGNTYSGNETVSVTSFISLTAVWEKSLPEIKSVQMIYLDKQISATNKVLVKQGFRISINVQ